MGKYIGRRLKIGIGKEDNRGAGKSPAFWVPVESFTFSDKIVKARSVAALGRLADSEEAFVLTQYGEGEMTGEVRDKSFGLLLYSLLGSLSTSNDTPEAGVSTHSFTLNQTNQHQSLSIVVADPNVTKMHKLCMVNELEIIAEIDTVVKYRVSFLGKRGVTSSESGSPTVENKFTKKHLSFKVASDISGLSSASKISLKRLRIAFGANVAIDDVLGSAEPEDFLNQQFSVEGELTLNYEDETWHDYMLNNTERALQIKLENDDTTIGSATHPSLTIQLPKVDFFDWTPNYALDEIVTQTISFKASYDVSNSQDIVYLCQLVNTQSSY